MRQFLLNIKEIFQFLGNLFASIFLIFFNCILAFIIGSSVLEVPCDTPDCSLGSNDAGVGIVVLFLVAFPSLIWLCLGELYIHIRKRKSQSRILMLIFPSIYAFVIMNVFLFYTEH